MSKSTDQTDSERVRLFISPFNPSLFSTIIPAASRALATSISYHHTQTEPDKGFGYLELPTTEADRLKKKLNGAILRGSKMSIDIARPEKRKAPSDEPSENAGEAKRSKTKSKTDANDRGNIKGVELPTDRKVKRGWTLETGNKTKSTKDKESSKSKSRFSEHSEVLFRTNIAEEAQGKDKKKKDKSGKKVMHEFENTTKFPTFLKQEKVVREGGPLRFEDGRGWVDENDNLIEPVRSKVRGGNAVVNATITGTTGVSPDPPTAVVVTHSDATKVDQETSSTSDSNETSNSSSSESDTDSDNDSTSSSDADAESETNSSNYVPSTAEINENTVLSTQSTLASSVPIATSESTTGLKIAPPTELHTASSSTMISTPLELAPSVETPTSHLVHPLEALYKRAAEEKPKMPKIQTSFTFFDEDEKSHPVTDNKAHLIIPQTPFTQQDLRVRGIRSAAPTPDTAVAPRRGLGGFGKHATPDPDDREPSEGVEEPGAARPHGRSALVQEFYERRADLNQNWKQRRRETVRSQKQRDEKRPGRSLI